MRKRLLIIGAAPGEVLPTFPRDTHHAPREDPGTPRNTRYGEAGLRLVTVGRAIKEIPASGDDPVPAWRGGIGQKLDPEGLAPTILASGGAVGHPDGERNLTLAELAAIQGFPPDYEFRGCMTSRRRQIGNAFPPVVARGILRHIGIPTYRDMTNAEATRGAAQEVPPSLQMEAASVRRVAQIVRSPQGRARDDALQCRQPQYHQRPPRPAPHLAKHALDGIVDQLMGPFPSAWAALVIPTSVRTNRDGSESPEGFAAVASDIIWLPLWSSGNRLLRVGGPVAIVSHHAVAREPSCRGPCAPTRDLLGLPQNPPPPPPPPPLLTPLHTSQATQRKYNLAPAHLQYVPMPLLRSPPRRVCFSDIYIIIVLPNNDGCGASRTEFAPDGRCPRRNAEPLHRDAEPLHRDEGRQGPLGCALEEYGLWVTAARSLLRIHTEWHQHREDNRDHWVELWFEEEPGFRTTEV
ncbi:hypothetical protein FGADI_11436, partial [Fusarium gaditjirri]